LTTVFSLVAMTLSFRAGRICNVAVIVFISWVFRASVLPLLVYCLFMFLPVISISFLSL
jgi:hypothetical protein